MLHPSFAPHLAPLDTDLTQAAVAVRGLVKRFGSKTAVDSLSLDIPRGSFFGLVGPNGAGKTTALSLITGLLRPDAGVAFVLGTDVWSNPLLAKATVGVLADGLDTFDRLSGPELVSYIGLLRGLAPAVIDERSRSLLAALDLESAGATLVADYSAGMTKKINLACALIHAPRVLILDEPFEAVDPVSAQVIRNILHQFVRGGGTVILSSHVMELVEAMCTHVAIVAQGRVLSSGTLTQVRQDSTLQQVFLGLVGERTIDERSLQWLK